jgi:hypothetical protein
MPALFKRGRRTIGNRVIALYRRNLLLARGYGLLPVGFVGVGAVVVVVVVVVSVVSFEFFWYSKVNLANAEE